MDIFKVIGSIVDFFSNKKNSRSKKLIWSIIGAGIIFVIFWADYKIGFTERWQTINSIEDITKIEILKAKVKGNDTLMRYLDSIERSILVEKHIYSDIRDFFSGKYEDTDASVTATKTEKINEPFNIWHLLSTSFIWLVVALILPILLFTQKNASENRAGTIAGIIAGVIVLCAFAWFFYYALGLIPVIDGKRWINYLIDVVVQIGVILLFYYIEKRSTKK